MALERVPYPGSVDFKYDSLPALGDRFAIGHRDVHILATNTLQSVVTKTSDHTDLPSLETVTAAAVQAQDSVETEVYARLLA